MKISSSLHTNYISKENTEKTESPNDLRKKQLSGGSIKKNSVLEELLKQKQNLVDSKNTITDEALKNGKSPSDIKDKLKNIDAQIKEIDGEISKVQLEDQKKALDTDEKSKKTENSKEKSENEEVQMDNILELSGNLAKVNVLSSQKKSMEGETRVLEGEIKLDKMRGLDPISKEERVAEIQDKMKNIGKNMGDNLKNINNEIKNVREGRTSTEAIDKNKQSKNDINTENQNNLSPSQIQISQNIQVYNDNLPENSMQDGEKVNVTA